MLSDGALFEPTTTTDSFPTEPAFIVAVEIRAMPQYGPDHHGVFATEPIPQGTKFWVWTDRVEQIRFDELETYLQEKTSHHDNENDQFEAKRVLIRQGFVLPSQDEVFNCNPTDAGRFMNHSSDPNCGPDGTLRDVATGEELTMNYHFHGNPQWYQDICAKYGVLTEQQVAMQFK